MSSTRRRIAVLSGKGGAGKTTVATGVARALAEAGQSVTLIDADAEAPDAGLALSVAWDEPIAIELGVPEIDPRRCGGCGACAASCRFNALAMAGTTPLLFPDLCHGCGACALICAEHGAAIHEQAYRIGGIRRGTLPWGRLIEARTAVGAARASRVIAAALEAAGGSGCQVVDGPPGTGCSAVAALTGADRALVVVEATPFGRYDAELAVALVRARGLDCGAVLNRWTSADAEATRAWCAAHALPIAAIIAEDPDLDRAGASGADPWGTAPDFAATCADLARDLIGQPCGARP